MGPFQLRSEATPESLSLVVNHSHPTSSSSCGVTRRQRGSVRPNPGRVIQTSRPTLEKQSGLLAHNVGMFGA